MEVSGDLTLRIEMGESTAMKGKLDRVMEINNRNQQLQQQSEWKGNKDINLNGEKK